jgi:hypothetical protein
MSLLALKAGEPASKRCSTCRRAARQAVTVPATSRGLRRWAMLEVEEQATGSGSRRCSTCRRVARQAETVSATSRDLRKQPEPEVASQEQAPNRSLPRLWA